MKCVYRFANEKICSLLCGVFEKDVVLTIAKAQIGNRDPDKNKLLVFSSDLKETSYPISPKKDTPLNISIKVPESAFVKQVIYDEEGWNDSTDIGPDDLLKEDSKYFLLYLQTKELVLAKFDVQHFVFVTANATYSFSGNAFKFKKVFLP